MSSTAVLEQPNSAEPEAFARTAPEILGQTCESCGGGVVVARYVAFKEKSDLFFCAHHIRANEKKLISAGFAIHPEDTSFDAFTKK